MITNSDLKLLIKHDWIVETNDQKMPISAINHSTGCTMRGCLVAAFVFNKIEELKEENTVFLTFEQKIEKIQSFGWNVLCESPLEIADLDGLISTGECAHFLLNHVTLEEV